MSATGLSRKNVVITGASSGIGLATLHSLLAVGARIFAGSRREPEFLSGENQDSQSHNLAASCYYHKLDLAERSSVDEFCRSAAARLGNVDVVLNIAGSIDPEPLAQMSDRDWDRHIEINLTAPFRIIRNLLPVMREGAAIVNVASYSGINQMEKFAGYGAYTAAKSGLVGLTEAWAADLKNAGIRINVLCPGAVATPMLEKIAPGYQAPLTASDVARQILFYAAPESRPVSGRIIPVGVG